MSQVVEPWFMRGGVPFHLEWGELWTKVLNAHGERTAIELEVGSLSFQQLDQEAQALALSISDATKHQTKGLIAVSTERADFLKAFIALWSLGSTVVPYSRKMFEQTPELRTLMASVVDGWVNSDYCLSGFGENPVNGARVKDFPQDQAQHAVYFTSGSTGQSKGVLRGWRQAIFEAGHYASMVGLEPGYRTTMLIEPTFGASTKQILAGLLMGCAQYFPNLVSGPKRVRGGHVLYGTPSHFLGGGVQKIEEDAPFQWVSLTGEAPNTKALQTAAKYLSAGGRILNAFGGTEFGVANNRIIDPFSLDRPTHCLLPHKHALILSEEGQALQGSGLGRLAIDSHYLAEGYLALDTQNVACFFAFPTLDEGRRRFVTGDIASLDVQEGIKLLGRSNNMIKHRGQWLDTSPLIALLSTSEPILDFAFDHDVSTGQIRIWIVCEKEADDPALLEALKFINQQVGERFSNLLTLRYGRADCIPRNRNGKVDYQALALKAFEMIPEMAQFLFDDIFDYLLHGIEPSLGSVSQSELSALGMSSIELLELAHRFEMASGLPTDLSLLLGDDTLINLRKKLWEKLGFREWPLELGSIDRRCCLLWFGFGGIVEVRRAFGAQSRILYWDCDVSFIAIDFLMDANIEDLVSNQLSPILDQLRGVDSILVGGFSFGALMALEAGHQLERHQLPVDRLVILDPPLGGGFQFNAFFRFLANCVSAALQGLPWNDRLSERINRRYRRSLRRTVISRFKANQVHSKSYIQTTQKRRSKIIRALAKACLSPNWQHESSSQHYEILSNPACKSRWLEVIDLWLNESTPVASHAPVIDQAIK